MTNVRWGVTVSLVAGLLAAGAIAERHEGLASIRFAIQRSPELMASSVVIPDAELAAGLPTVSLYLEPKDLHDPETGILPNKTLHGRQWERPGALSYFEGGRLRYASTAGVRIHGGGSRYTSPRQGFRLYFRKQYGSSEPLAGVLFGSSRTDTLRRLIIHNDMRLRGGPQRVPWHLVNPLAYDIARAVGGITSDTRPVRFFVNGEFYGVFVLSEHFDPEDYFRTHFGHEVRLVGEEFTELFHQVTSIRPVRMATVGRLVDLENLTRWFIATLFCATGDPFQGPGLYRDPTRAQSQWFWVNWDMDLSFSSASHDTFYYLLQLPGAPRRGRRHDETRSIIMTDLLQGDAEYREYFKRVWAEVMNHRLTADFLRERFEHYRKIAIDYGLQDLRYLEPLEAFLERRPDVVRELAERYLQTGPSVKCTMAASGRPVTLDGYPVPGGFPVYNYFPGMTLTLDVPEGQRKRFSYWRVNGTPHPRGRTALTLRADQDLQVVAIWK